MVSCLKVMLNVLFAWNSNKMKACHEHRKTLDLINKKALLTKKVLLHYEPTNKTETSWNKNQEALQAWSNRARNFFGRTRTGSILQLWCNSPSVSLSTKAFVEMLDCVEALDHVCPQFLRAETLLEFEQRWYVDWKEHSPELFFSICSSKLEASHTCLQRLQLFLKMGVTVSALFIFHVSRSKSGVVDSLRTYISTWCMYVCYLQWMDVYVRCKCMYMHIREFIL